MPTERNTANAKRECLDSIEVAHRNRIYPLIFCRMSLRGALDIGRLIEAVQCSTAIVPEVLYAYDFETGCFVDQGITADQAVVENTEDFGEGWKWDLGKGPQLKIALFRKSSCCDNGRRTNADKADGNARFELAVAMSHILADGMGFIQYLYLLSSIYNREEPHPTLRNERDIEPILDAIRVGKPTDREKAAKGAQVRPLSLSGEGNTYRCCTVDIDSADMESIHRKAKSCGATLNDAFLAAYARVVAHILDEKAVVLPCPADLRRFAPKAMTETFVPKASPTATSAASRSAESPDPLTIANMTGMFKVAAEVEPHDPFERTLDLIHDEIKLQKERCRCFAGIPFLHRISRLLPARFIDRMGRAFYNVPPVSYTNFGIIDGERLSFAGCKIERCYLTGTYRLPPELQLSVSTYRGASTLSCCAVGSEERLDRGQKLLVLVKNQLIEWALA